MQERIAIFAATRDIGEKMARHLQSYSLNVIAIFDLSHINADKAIEDLLNMNPTLVFLDMHLNAESDATLKQLALLHFWDIEASIEAGINLPQSITLLVKINKLKEKITGLLVFVFYEDTTIHLTQVLLRVGADWVWPYRLPREISIDKVIPQLRMIIDSVPPLSILVVDNSAKARSNISQKLRGRHIITDAKAGVAEVDIDIIPSDVIREFQDGAYQVVIMDLGLKPDEENKLERLHLPNLEQVIKELNSEHLKEIAGGVITTLWILENYPEMVIVIFSNYVKKDGKENTNFINALNRCFGHHKDRIAYLSKELEELDQLAPTLENLYNRLHTTIPHENVMK